MRRGIRPYPGWEPPQIDQGGKNSRAESLSSRYPWHSDCTLLGPRNHSLLLFCVTLGYFLKYIRKIFFSSKWVALLRGTALGRLGPAAGERHLGFGRVFTYGLVFSQI